MDDTNTFKGSSDWTILLYLNTEVTTVLETVLWFKKCKQISLISTCMYECNIFLFYFFKSASE